MSFFEVLQEWLKKITYKPTFFFRMDKEPFGEMVHLTVSANVLNVDDPTKFVTVAMSNSIHMEMIRSEDIFQHFVFKTIEKFEMHERDEWFKWKGVPINIAHPEKYQGVALR